MFPDRISRAHVNVAWIREKQGLLRGIAADAVELLKDRQLAVGALRKMMLFGGRPVKSPPNARHGIHSLFEDRCGCAAKTFR